MCLHAEPPYVKVSGLQAYFLLTPVRGAVMTMFDVRQMFFVPVGNHNFVCVCEWVDLHLMLR